MQKNPALRSVSMSEIFLPSTSSNQMDNANVGISVRLNTSIVRKTSMPKLATFNEMLEWDRSSENLQKDKCLKLPQQPEKKIFRTYS